MIHKALRVSEVAKRYYKKKSPKKKYETEQARKQFWQEPKIDILVLKQVIDEIFTEQNKMLK